MTYRAPVADILYTMKHAARLEAGIADGIYADIADDHGQSVLETAAKLAEEVLAPLNRTGDTTPALLKDGAVTTPPGFADAYRHWIEGGWSGLAAPDSAGGMDLPLLLHTACLETWSAANMAFMLCPILSFGAIDALEKHGTEQLQQVYLPKIVSGEWTATMNLTEPSAGSDLNALRSRAERADDGTYRIFGQKIYITYGEHDMTDNIVHLVLARLPDAPAGTRGISLFLVPKFIPDENGNPGERNDVRCHSIEHKMGIHASPTCTMIYGDGEGAKGWLVGEENRGLACMFTMMNSARLATGLQGVSVGDRAYQQALSYARERRQGRPPGWTQEGMAPIVRHPDVQRMLMTMKALTASARAICYMTAEAIDRARRAPDEAARAAAHERASLLTPLAKAYSTDIGNEVASLGVQVHGGMGFIEETGAAQHFRDIRIAAIYEGTNGIQAIDLVQRKLPLSGGETMRREIADMRATVEELKQANTPAFGQMPQRLEETLDALEDATQWIGATMPESPADVLAGATPYLRLFSLARGGTGLARMALAASRESGNGDGDGFFASQIATARFFAEHICTPAPGLAATVTGGAGSVHAGEFLLAGAP